MKNTPHGSHSDYHGNSIKLSRHQIWQAFVQESVCSIAEVSKINLEIQDGLAIDDVTKQAFSILDESGIIHAIDQHTCQECTQPYKRTADIIIGDYPAALVGIDEKCSVPALTGENAGLAAAEAAEQVTAIHAASIADQEMDIDLNNDGSYIKMAVVDGIVISPLHFAYDNCTSELANSRGGSFCALHELCIE